MTRRFITVVMVVLMLPALILAQDLILKPDGSLEKIKAHQKEAINVTAKERAAMESKSSFGQVKGAFNTLATPDTLSYNVPQSTNFGEFGQDVMVQWFVAPADLEVIAVAIAPSDMSQPNVEVKIVNSSAEWGEAEFFAEAAPKWEGWYEAVGNGYNDIGHFQDDESTTGGWVPADVTSSPTSPWGEDLWSDGGLGAPVTVTNDVGTYEWVQMDLLGFFPEVLQDGVFGVAVKNTWATLDDFAENRFGLMANNTLGVPAWKFYANGRFSAGTTPDPGSWGWWSRTYTWDIIVAVSLTGDRGPSINDLLILPGGILDTGPQTITATVTDDNPSGGDAGVSVAHLQWSIDGGATWTNVTMTADGDVYSGDIPGQVPGTIIDYQIHAVDVNGLETTSLSFSYAIFEQVENALIVFNGLTSPSGYPQSYYFADGSNNSDVDADVWSFGGLTAELINFYTHIIEITTTGPTVINNNVISTWLAGDAGRNYMLAGDEWMGAQSGWPESEEHLGDFHSDTVGIAVGWNDIVGGSADISKNLIPQPGSALGGELADSVAALSPDSLFYDPNFEIGVVNWLDGFEIVDGWEVDLWAVNPNNGDTLSILHHGVLSAGNKVAMFGYDPLSLNSNPYVWYGYALYSPQNKVLDWFGITYATDIEDQDKDALPNSYKLAQNYPNPFNPVTTISYALPKADKVQLKIYDITGREVTTLVNENQSAGTHAVQFDASRLASGVYMYTISSGDFFSSKKMVLIK